MQEVRQRNNGHLCQEILQEYWMYSGVLNAFKHENYMRDCSGRV